MNLCGRFILLFVFLGFFSISQESSISLFFTEKESQSPVIGVIIFVAQDTLEKGDPYLTDASGYVFPTLNGSKDTFFLSQDNLGYKPFKFRPYSKSNIDSFHIQLEQKAIDIGSVTLDVSESITQKEDTTVYKADALHHETNESAKDLINKLPDTQLKDGTVTIEGDKVNTVAINGQNYAGGTKSALKNIPSDIIQKIEVIDVVSPEDPSITFKKINLITKNKQVRFGKISAKYGVEDRYRIAGNKYFHKGKHRYTLMGDYNNINHEDLLDNSIENLYKGNNKLLAGVAQYVFKSKRFHQETNFSGNNLNRSIFEQSEVQPNFNSLLPFSLNIDSNNTNYSLFNIGSLTKIKTAKNNSLKLRLQYNYSDRLDNNSSYYEQYFETDDITGQLAQNHFEGREESFSGGVDYAMKFKTDTNRLPSKLTLSLNYSQDKASYRDSIFLSNDLDDQNWTKNTQEKFENLKFKSSYKSFRKKGMWYVNFNSYYWLNNQENEAKELVGEDYVNRLTPSQGFNLNQSIHSVQLGWVKKMSKSKLNLYAKEVVCFDDQPKYYFLPGLIYLRNKTKRQNTKVYFGGKVNRPVFEKKNNVIQNWQRLTPIIGNTSLTPFVSWTGYVKYKKIQLKKFSYNSKVRFTFTKDPINRVVTFLNNDSVLGDVFLLENSQLLQWDNLNYQMFSNGFLNYEKNFKKNKAGIRLGYVYNQTQSRINGTEQWMYLKRVNTTLFTQLKSNELLFYNASIYGNIGGSGSSLESFNVVPYSWYFNQEIKYLWMKKLLISLDSRIFQASEINEKPQAPVSVISGSAKYLSNDNRFAIELTVHDLLNQNKDLVLKPEPNTTTFQRSNLLQRYTLLGITYKF